VVRDVVIAGGGVGALEGLLALRALSERLRISVVTASRHFTYPALSVAEPFGAAPPPRYDWQAIAHDRGASWVPDMLTGVRPDACEIDTRDGRPLHYDALLLALGARPQPALPGAVTFAGPRDVLAVTEAIEALRPGRRYLVALVAPPGVDWTLPLYELALLTAERAGRTGLDLALEVVTHEPRPLAAFGVRASDTVARRLEGAGIALRPGAQALAVSAGALTLQGAEPLVVDVAIALPRLTGPAVAGLPHDDDGFIPVDAYGRVRGQDGIWAVGDMTSRPLKQGGLAAQQADVAAAAIAARAAEAVKVVPYEPVLRGLLLTGGEPAFLEKLPGAPPFSHASEQFLWWPPQKVAGRHLAPYLKSLGAPPLPGDAA
jgi:sulfide:quinone oxidoreductase